MRTFKKLMSGALAAAIVATMSVSAFAAELNDSNKVVLGSSETYTPAGQTTVLIVPAENWVNDALTGLEDEDILYIDQYESADDATTAITAGLGVKLTDGKLADGDYYVLFGGKTGSNDTFAIKAFKMTVGNNTIIAWGDVNGDGVIDNADAVRLFRHTAGIESLTYSSDATTNATEINRICNVNGDTLIDNADAVRLFRHTAGIESITGMGLGDLSDK